MSPSIRQFMSISMAGVTFFLLALLYFQIKQSDESLAYHLTAHSKNLATVLRNSILAKDLEVALIENGSELSTALLEQIKTTLEMELREVPVEKVKIYNKTSIILFSTASNEIGENATGNRGVQTALAGLPASGIASRHHVNDLHDQGESQTLYQLYLPIKIKPDNEVIGVFEIYSDISQVLVDIAVTRNSMIWPLAGILIAIYLALGISFFSTQRRLRRDTAQRQSQFEGMEQSLDQARAELDHAKEYLQSVVNGIGNPLLVIKPDFTIALMNTAARNLIPKNQDRAEYQYCHQVLRQRDQPCTGPDLPCSFDPVIKQACALRTRHTRYDSNKQLLIADLLTTPIYAADGEFAGVIEVEHDVTQLVRMQTGLLDSEIRLHAIMDNVPDAILTCDSDYVIQSTNTSALRLFNGREFDLVGKSLNLFFPDDSNLCVVHPETAFQRESILRRLDGSEFPADIWIGPLELADHMISYVAVVRDITLRIKAQKELDSTRQFYFHREKMAAIGQLAAGIIHEVGNPIAAISGATSELKAVDINPDRLRSDDSLGQIFTRNIELIQEQTTRLSRITREIADFASPKQRERELLDLNGLLESTARLLSYDRRFSSVELDFKLDSNLPAIVGVADQLTQVFMNLLINAADACSSESEKKYSIDISSKQDGGRAHISIRDNGQGMSQETLAHTLEPFYTTKPFGKGSGLGLSLCDTIILAHRGTLQILSEEQKGTTVHVFLPIDSIDETPD